MFLKKSTCLNLDSLENIKATETFISFSSTGSQMQNLIQFEKQKWINREVNIPEVQKITQKCGGF